MNYREIEAKRNREYLEQLLRDRVIDENFDLDGLETLRGFIENRAESEEPAAEFCDWFELGNWFYEAMLNCDFDVERFMERLEEEMRAEMEEAARDRAEIEADYRRMVGF